MARYAKSKKNVLSIILVVAIVVLLITGALMIFLNTSRNLGGSKLYLQTDANLVAMSGEEFYVDIKLSDFPEDGVYSASSFMLEFDSSKLEFTGLRLGTMSVSDENGENLNAPAWECNTDISNQKSIISAMYIDMTANNSSYRNFGYEKDSKDILVRVEFILKDSAIKNDELKFKFTDAVLASTDKAASLSMVNETLKVSEYKLKVN